MESKAQVKKSVLVMKGVMFNIIRGNKEKNGYRYRGKKLLMHCVMSNAISVTL